MEDKQLMDQIRRLKTARNYTLYELSKKLDVQVATVDRWLRSNRINRVYAQLVKSKLNLK